MFLVLSSLICISRISCKCALQGGLEPDKQPGQAYHKTWQAPRVAVLKLAADGLHGTAILLAQIFWQSS